MAGLVVVVTGTRLKLTPKGKEKVSFALDDILYVLNPDDQLIVMHGACPSGVDDYVNHCGLKKEYLWPFPANWSMPNAGPTRNAAMVRVAAGFMHYGHRALCLGFPAETGSGTQHCMRMADKAGIEVKAFPLTPETDYVIPRQKHSASYRGKN